MKFLFIDNFTQDTSKEDFTQLINLIREKSKSLNKYADKIQILTIHSPTWTAKKISYEMNCSKYLAQEAKFLQMENGLLSRPERKKIERFTEESEEIIEMFYCQDDVSRIMLGKKDCISIRVDGQKRQIQKPLILGNLKEIYLSFKEHNPMLKFDFSKFADLSPQYCILVGPKGTHTVCVCLKHQNVVLMVSAAHLKKISEPSDNCPKDYKEIIQRIMCFPPSIHCHLGHCDQCPGFDIIKTTFNNIFHRKGIQEFTFNEWTSTDRCQLESKTYSVDNYFLTLEKRIIELKSHDFIAKSQNNFLKEAKLKLKNNEFIVLLDFSENYSSVIQDEVQAHHWSHKQSTIHPFVIYYKENNEILHKSFVVISDHLKHDTSAFYYIQKELIKYLKKIMVKKSKKSIIFPMEL